MKKICRLKKLFILFAALAMLFAGCAKTSNDDTTNTLVMVTNMEALAGAEGGSPVLNLNSDVCANSGASFPGCTAIEDYGQVTIAARPKSMASAFPTGLYNSVVFERYRVSFMRTDGRNTPGLDIPFSFDGAMNLVVDVGLENSWIFVLVRHQSKLEPPLVNMAGNGGAIVLSTIATVDFYGRDVAGRPVTATGQINVTFGDF